MKTRFLAEDIAKYLHSSWPNDDTQYTYRTIVTYQLDNGLSNGDIIDIVIDNVIDIDTRAYVLDQREIDNKTVSLCTHGRLYMCYDMDY